jgi:hypothetical protein
LAIATAYPSLSIGFSPLVKTHRSDRTFGDKLAFVVVLWDKLTVLNELQQETDLWLKQGFSIKLRTFVILVYSGKVSVDLLFLNLLPVSGHAPFSCHYFVVGRAAPASVKTPQYREIYAGRYLPIDTIVSLFRVPSSATELHYEHFCL